jgi:hypothetical protein
MYIYTGYEKQNQFSNDVLRKSKDTMDKLINFHKFVGMLMRWKRKLSMYCVREREKGEFFSTEDSTRELILETLTEVQYSKSRTNFAQEKAFCTKQFCITKFGES